MFADLKVAATGGLHKFADDVITIPSAVFFLGVGELHDEMREKAHVAFLPEENTVGGHHRDRRGRLPDNTVR